MTNSKIRNFFETLRSIKEHALHFHMYSFKRKSNEVLELQTDHILNFRTLHFKRSNVYFCFDNRLCDLQIRIFSERYTVLYTQNEASFVFLLRKVKKNFKKQNKKHLELKTWYFRL